MYAKGAELFQSANKIPVLLFVCFPRRYHNIQPIQRVMSVKMVDIFSRIKTQQIMWLKCFMKDDNSDWKIIPAQYLKKVGGMQFFLRCNFDIKMLNCHIPKMLC